jgi:hypothetical protein
LQQQLCFIDGITSGSGIEFLSGLNVDDVDLANNYFIYSGQTCKSKRWCKYK